MTYKRFLLSVFTAVNLISYAIATDRDQEELDHLIEVKQFVESSSLEGFLGKTKKSMTKVSRGRYTLDDAQFNKIFPQPVINTANFNSCVGFIENEIVDIATGTSHIEAGTGTVIENNYQTVKILTAAHVVRNPGTITFILASGLTMPNTINIVSFADYKATKVFLHKSKDVAYIECSLESDRVSPSSQAPEDKKLRTYFMNRNHQIVDGRKEVKIFHYPFAVEDQRFNTGSIFPGTNEHTVPTLGGSSGAPIIYNNQIVGIHTNAGVAKGGSGTVQYDGQSQDFEFRLKNEYVRLSDISQDLSDFVERT